MKKVRWLKITLSSVLALSVLVGLFLSVSAAVIPGTDVNISSLGAGSPDIEVSSNGVYVAVAYYKQANGETAVYVKSATSTDGWQTSSLVGFGNNAQLAFKAGSNDTVYVVWARSDGAAIQSSECILSSLASPACTLSSVDVRTATPGSLENPDVAVSTSGANSGVIHVAWVNNGFIETARSSSASSLGGWSSPVTVSASGGGNDQKPVIAWSNSRVHLAFLRGAALTSVEYRFSGDGSHSWSGTNFALGANVNGTSHNYLDNPTIAASGNNVFLAFDAHQIVGVDTFSLIQVTSINNGSSWSSPTYAPSGTVATSDPPGTEIKFSQAVGVPSQETGLRPSLAISSTGAALTWQEIPGLCANSVPSTIHFANPPTGSGFDELSDGAVDDDFMIDPDLAVAGTTRHFVFMKHADIGCPGELAADYVISYRGPFTVTTNDRGENNNGIYLPIIKKNS